MSGFKPKAKAGKSGAQGKLSGGHWVTIHGHPAYIKGGKVVAGGVVGHTHDAKGKPTGKPDRLDKGDAKLARDHVVKQEKAARIRRNTPGADTSGVDHGAANAAVKSHGGTYSHGAPRTGADREHLARAEKAGGTAVKITNRPKVRTQRGRETTSYHVGDSPNVARVEHNKNKDGKYEVQVRRGSAKEVTEHRTLAGAHKAARKAAREDARDTSKTLTRRLVVRHGSGEGRAQEIGRQSRNTDEYYQARVHVLHRGRGSGATIPGSGFRPKS